MKFKRKKYILDKYFQLRISFKAVIFPLIITLIIGAVLFYFAKINNNYTKEIVSNQEQMIELFLTTPALYNTNNPIISNGEKIFQNNIKMLMEIKRNSSIVLYFIIIMIVIQSVIIFVLFIYITHKISGPIYVMTQLLKELKQGGMPKFRPLRKKDELQDIYAELWETIEYLSPKK
ncbi:MAG: hypothetical protein SVR08_11570 [Spirochaetota bacterium]|nr:hypothetical protein [Spirochaetota bacterium]